MATGVTDCCYKDAEEIRARALRESLIARQATALTIAMANAYQIVKNYRKQKSISDRGMAISQEIHDQMKNLYYPAEIQFLTEFGDNGGEEIEEVEVMGRRYGGRLRAIVADAYAKKIAELKCNIPRYCTSSVQKQLQDLYSERAFALASAGVMGQNIAFAEYRARWDTAINRRLQAIALGRNLMDVAANLYSSAGAGLASATTGFRAQLNEAIGNFRSAGIDASRYTHYDIMRRAGGTMEDAMLISGGIYDANQSYQPNVVYSAGNAVSDNMTAIYGQNGDVTGNLYNDGTSPGSVQSDLINTKMTNFIPTTADAINTAGSIGNADTIRTGEMTYAVQGASGGTVTVKMGDFKQTAVDNTTASGGI